jgi:hypothetical protein
MEGRVRSGSLQVVCGLVPEADRSKLPTPTRESKVLWRGRFLKKTYGCGHRDSMRFQVSVCGHIASGRRQKDWCPACLIDLIKLDMIFCALCGLPIVPYDMVAVRDADSEGVRADAHRIGDQVITCVNPNCDPYSWALLAFLGTACRALGSWRKGRQNRGCGLFRIDLLGERGYRGQTRQPLLISR